MSERPRIEPLPEADWDDLLRGVLSAAPGGKGGRPVNVFTTLARHPKLFGDWIRLGARLLAGSSFSPRERELAILRTAHNCRSEYEWAQHVEIGRAAGLSDHEIAAVRLPPREHPWDEAELLVLEAVDELHGEATLGDATWARLAERYDEQQLIELPMLVGHYTMLAYALNALGVQVEGRRGG
jgi:alkylhydroperoxidase family enzyme